MGCSSSANAAANEEALPALLRACEQGLQQGRALEEREQPGDAEALYRKLVKQLEDSRTTSALPQHASWLLTTEACTCALGRVLEAQGKHAEAVFHRRRLDILRAA